VQHSVRHFIDCAARELGIKLRFEGSGPDEIAIVDDVSGDKATVKPGQIIVRVDSRYFRPTEVESLLGDPTKARTQLGWVPQTSFDALVAEMIHADYASARRDALVKSAGFQAFDYNE
jgi:GDPmannose 4,6-dehydratase